MSDIEILVVGGIAIGAAIELTKGHVPDSMPVPPITYGDTPLGGSTVGQITGQGGTGTPTSTSGYANNLRNSIRGLSTGGTGSGVGISNPTALATGGSGMFGWISGGGGGGGGSETDAKCEAVTQAAHDAWDKMDDAAKEVAVKKLNELLHINPPIILPTDWKTITSRASGAAGFMVGDKIGSAIGGPGGALVGGYCGAFLGGKIEDWVGENYDGVVAWCEDKVNSIGSWIKDEASSIYDDTIGAVF